MAGDTFLRRALVRSICMATAAGDLRMSARQRELCACRMVESRITPDCRCMAQRAVLREAGIHMFRILGAVVSSDVTACTVLRKVCIHSAFMACVARNRRVAARQRELRRR